MVRENFQNLINNITKELVGKTLNTSLADELNQMFPSDSEVVKNIKSACKKAIQEGWMCDKEHDGIKFGRVIKDINGFSVDVVEMEDVVGPHHMHPNGEIDLIMPLDGEAKFDDHGAGWVVYGPGSSHNPTVTDGRALVLYLLPEGKIDFTRN